MSVLREYPDAIINNKDLQIWNNAAFDDSENPNSIKPNKPVFVNPSFDSIDSSFSSKENQSPSVLLSRSPLKNHSILSKQSTVANREKQIDDEIEQIENEISRLSSRLESLRLEKTAQNLEKQGRITGVTKNREESGFPRTKSHRRGFSLGPNEIMSATNSKSKPTGTTPVQSVQNRRKSCFWKLQDIEEDKVGFSRGIRQAVTSVGAKKGIKKDDSVLLSVQPKKLFGDRSVPAKKPLKLPGRVIASRYNQATVNSSMRKRSLSENGDGKLCENDNRVKKKWEVPKRLELGANENECLVVLPRIKAVRCVNDTPRGSGQVKRAADLVGKKSYFGFDDDDHDDDEDEDEGIVCQRLSFEEE